MDGEFGSRTSHERLICVVWSTCSAPLPTSVANALAGKGLTVVQRDTPLGALAALGSDVRRRRLAGDERGRPVALIVEPSRLPDSPRFVDVLDRYLPGVPRWVCTTAGGVQLRQLLISDLPGEPDSPASEPRPEVVVKPYRVMSKSPSLKLTGGDGVDLPPQSVDEASENPLPAHHARQVLTEEELAMLLDDDAPGRGSSGL